MASSTSERSRDPRSPHVPSHARGDESTDSPNPTDKLQVAWTSVFVTIFLIAAKLIIGLMTGSLAILSQAADSGFDLVAVLITLLAVRISSVPPDEDHPYGHGKFESLSALLQSLLLLGITVWIAIEAVGHLTGNAPRNVEVNGWSFGVLFASIGLDLWRARMLRRAAREHHSHALEASAVNFFTDILSAIVALIGLSLLKFWHVQNADDWAALALAVFVAGLSVKLGKGAIDGLTDRFESQEQYAKLKLLVEETSGIESVSRIRIRPAGPSLFVEVSVSINRILPFAAIERILSEVETSIKTEFSNADVTVHWKPVRTGSEAPFDTLKVIVAEFGILPHNVELAQTESGDVTLDYHLEFRPGMQLEEAEETCKLIEAKVKADLPQISHVFAHLEEERSDRSLPVVTDISSDRESDIREITFYAKAANRSVRQVRSIHLFEETGPKTLKLMLAVDVDRNLSLAEAHDIATNVEMELRKRFPELSRILVHANPVD